MMDFKPMIKQGDIVKIKQEYQDFGDDKLIWVALDNEEKGRVTIQPSNIEMIIKPVQVINVHMLEQTK